MSTVERQCSRGTASFHSYMGRTNVQPSQIRFAAWPEPRDLSRDLNCAGGTSSSLVKGKVTNTVGVEAHGCEQLAQSRRTQQTRTRFLLVASLTPYHCATTPLNGFLLLVLLVRVPTRIRAISHHEDKHVPDRYFVFLDRGRHLLSPSQAHAP